MTISVGTGEIPAGRVRTVYRDREIYPNGTELLVQFKQLSGPPNLTVRLQLGVPVKFMLRMRRRWEHFYEFDRFTDDRGADDWDMARIDYPDVVLNSGAPIRAVVIANVVAEEPRGFRLSVAPANKP